MNNDKNSEDPYEEKTRLQRSLEADTFAGLANTLFGDVVDQYGHLISDLEGDLRRAGSTDLFRTYVSKMVLASLMAFIIFFAGLIPVFIVIEFNIALKIVLGITMPPIAALIVFIGYYIYPSRQAKRRQQSIENNLPFALNQMSAVASSGVPPGSMFKLLVNFEEYGEISKEAEKIVKKTSLFGEDLTTAMRETALETPSEELKEILYGMISTIETGGSLNEFLSEQAESALFDYQVRREKQIENLSTYASFYTALLIAAPLFLIAVLAIMNIIGGDLFGFAIGDIMNVGVYVVIPFINLLFIGALQLTQGDIE